MAQEEYKATIGMEIHAELKTATKMFCCSKNDPNEPNANVNICPVCLAHPGTLPVINREAVRHVLRVGVALGAKIADYTEFDRKNYFYPDLPKGYQISQYEFPLVAGGELAGVAITRVHLEEDTASSIHNETTGATLIDYNRSGVPLMELVTDPVIHSATQAGSFARELQLLLRYLGASDANMEKGEMRVEANISVSKTDVLGTKVEVKNLNSFRAMERAVEYEIKRHVQILDGGGQVRQETLGWDDSKQATFPQRLKEGSADYRYFPDPDLPSLKISEMLDFDYNTLKGTLPELPADRRQRYINLGVRAEDAEAYIRTMRLGKFFEEVIAGYPTDSGKITTASNYIANDLVKIMRDTVERDTEIEAEIPISATYMRKIIDMVGEDKISSRSAKDLLALCVREQKDPNQLAQEQNLLKSATSPEQVQSTVLQVITDHPEAIVEYRGGKTAIIEFLVGKSMKSLRGAADPDTIRAIIKEALSTEI